VKDFEPIGTVASLPQILVANPQFPPNTVAELTALAKAKPGTLSFASVGNGSPGHLAGELYKLRTGTQLTMCPIAAAARPSPTSWAARCRCSGSRSRGGAVREGRQAEGACRLDHQAQRRVPGRADDAGGRRRRLRGRSWYAMFVPAKTPKPIIEKLNKALNTVVQQPDIKEKLLAQGSEGVGGTPRRSARPSTTSSRAGASSSGTPTSSRSERGGRPRRRRPGRARPRAQRAFERWPQERVDAAVVAAGWAIVEPGRNRELAELAVAATASATSRTRSARTSARPSACCATCTARDRSASSPRTKRPASSRSPGRQAWSAPSRRRPIRRHAGQQDHQCAQGTQRVIVAPRRRAGARAPD
jgi:hypothetical protein